MPESLLGRTVVADKVASDLREALDALAEMAEMAEYAQYHLDPEWRGLNGNEFSNILSRAREVLRKHRG